MSALRRIPPLARFEESPLRRQLMERLRRAAPAQIVTYSELSALIGEDVQRHARHLQDSARRGLLREHLVFTAVTNQGLKRLMIWESLTIRRRVCDDYTEERSELGASSSSRSLSGYRQKNRSGIGFKNFASE